MPAAASTDVDLAFGARFGLPYFSGFAGLPVGRRKGAFDDESSLLAGLQTIRVGGLGGSGLACGARITSRIIQPGRGQLSRLCHRCSVIRSKLARISVAVFARGQETPWSLVAERLLWFDAVRSGSILQTDLFAFDLLA
jgi:hypothetical protein